MTSADVVYCAEPGAVTGVFQGGMAATSHPRLDPGRLDEELLADGT